MTFNEFGHILAVERRRAAAADLRRQQRQDSRRVRTYCDKVKNCQGILALNGEVFVTGEGPDGPASIAWPTKTATACWKTCGRSSSSRAKSVEHGPHGLVLGPDGLIYVMLGNHTTLDGELRQRQPAPRFLRRRPRRPQYEDPGGHAVGIKAPGGIVIRTDTEGSGVQTRRRRSAQSLRPGLQPRGRTVHPRRRHGVRRRHLLVSAHARLPRHPRRRIRLAERLGELARLLRRLAARRRRNRPRLARPASWPTTTSCSRVRYHGALFTADWSQGKSWPSS